MTCCRSLGVSGVSAVRDRQVDGEASVIAEAFEAAVFLLGELAIHPDVQVGAIGNGCIR